MREEEFKRWMMAKDFSEGTIRRTLSYARYIERMGLDLDSIDKPADILDYFYRMRDAGKSRKTLNNHVKIINRYLDFRGKEFRIPYYREYRKEDIVIMSDSDVSKILSVHWRHFDTDIRNRAMLHLLFATGMRINELISLNLQDIRYDPRLDVHFVIIRHGKFDKYREVPIPPSIVRMIEDYKKYRIPSDPNALFTTWKRRITNSHARAIMAAAGRKAGLPWFHAHLARHWRAVTWLKEGVDIETIRRMMGHSSIKVTQIYLRARQREEMIMDLIQKDRAFGEWEVREDVES